MEIILSFSISVKHLSTIFRWHIFGIVLVLQMIFVSIVYPVCTIKGCSQWSNLLLTETEGHWNYWNESSHFTADCGIHDCYGDQTDDEVCPTQLKIVSDELKTIPNNLFVNCFVRLNSLNVSSCGIAEISRNSFAHAANLVKLDLSHNQITIVPNNTFELAPKVEIIDLSFNQIGLDGSAEYAFENCTSLKQLDLSNNKITYISHTGNEAYIFHIGRFEMITHKLKFQFPDYRFLQ